MEKVKYKEYILKFMSGSVATKGALWLVLEYAFELVIRLGSSMIMTRLLFPEAFGLMALVSTVMYALVMFSDTGINTSVIRDARGEEKTYLDTAWTIQVFRGIVLFLFCFLLAPVVSEVYKEPELLDLLRVMAVLFLIGGVRSLSVPLATRNIDLGRLTISKIASKIISVVVMVTWALINPSVWALVVSSMVNIVLLVALSYFYVSDIRHRFTLEKKAVGQLVTFGKWIFISSIVSCIAFQLDRLVIGFYADIATLGIYSIAIVLSEPVKDINWKISSSVIYPLLGKANRDDEQSVGIAYIQAKKISDALFLPGVGLLAVLAPYIVNILYDSRYGAAGWMLQILCIRTGIQCLIRNSEHCIVAFGNAKYSFYQNVARFTAVVIFLPVGWHVAQIKGIIWAITISELFPLLVLWHGLVKYKVFNAYIEMLPVFYGLGTYLLVSIFISLFN